MVSQTSCPGRESDRELSGAGRRAELYSASGIQRNSGDLRFDELGDRFSATGRRGRFAIIPAKCGDYWPLPSYFSDNQDLMAEKSEFEHVIHILLCQQVT
jgi:hypothetical protein